MIRWGCVMLVLFGFLYHVTGTESAARWKLVWHDEFNGTSLDTTKWAYTVGGTGFGNNELEYYTDRLSNVYLDHGMLVIQAIRETYVGADGIKRSFTSGRIQTRGKFSQAYGRFEGRIRIPYGHGVWPAFWMMGDGTDAWPDCGEIDIMENIGREPSTVRGTIHGPGYSGSKGIGASFSLFAKHFSDDFHVYAVEWEPRAIRWYVDDKLYKSVNPTDIASGSRWVFDHPFYLLLNLAIGGNLPGNPDETTVFPQTMYVDYVRAYQRRQ